MKKKRLITRTIILVVMALAVGYTLYANMNKDKNNKIVVGEPAPDFVLVDMEGNKHRLSEYKGQGVFLNFWATWCKPCEREMPYIENQYQQFKDQGVQVLAIDSGETDLVVNRFIDRKGLNFPVMIDDGAVQSTYGINPLPITFLIDKEGNVVRIHTGELTEETVRAFMEQIKP
ncbi:MULTISPECIES: thiol-disulfide oxidoreductase ResA [Mesobacillus]|uniref:Thiol-disulfide oxidoreductase n=2 Tax=Mesobacillus TaxID=2675231 RepID=A0A0D6Z7R7_9BACI|nr:MULTISPECIES: thiol-disulfide oxidoreductase ResA [Mesobacillus]KIY21617.1 thiol-disulfide oxidoreductase [Mesobacillus subterraneus]MDQ0413801.1 peroxiredoxin [Mesobacillus stamsii]